MSERRSSLRSTYSQRLDTVVFQGREEFEGGGLPSERHVIEMMIWALARRVGKPQTSVPEAARIVTEVLRDHWVWSNCYPKYVVNIKNQVESLYLEFKSLRETRVQRQTDNWKKNKLLPFLERVNKCGFDIRTSDANYLSKMEKEYGIKMEEEDKQFLEDQVNIIIIMITIMIIINIIPL